MESPCVYMQITTDPLDPLKITPVTDNNACARQNRDRYQELQAWIRGRQQ